MYNHQWNCICKSESHISDWICKTSMSRLFHSWPSG